jgi:hypothetical protein
MNGDRILTIIADAIGALVLFGSLFMLLMVLT